MSNIFKLIYNELIKIFIRKSTWVLYSILALIIIATGFIAFFADVERSGEYADDTWREELVEENAELEVGAGQNIFQYSTSFERIQENNYYLEEDIQPVSYGAWQFVADSGYITALVTLLTIVVAGGIVANEFRWGTIKLLLIRPYSRSTILLTKFLAVFVFAILTLVFVTLLAWIVGVIFFGFDGINPYIVNVSGSTAEYVSVINGILVNYGYGFVSLVMMATLAFMISSVFRSSTLAISITIVLMMSGNTVIFFLTRYDWAKYILFANTDLSQYADGGSPMIDGMTLQFSIIVLAVYFVIFVIAAWLIFGRRDVAGD